MSLKYFNSYAAPVKGAKTLPPCRQMTLFQSSEADSTESELEGFLEICRDGSTAEWAIKDGRVFRADLPELACTPPALADRHDVATLSVNAVLYLIVIDISIILVFISASLCIRTQQGMQREPTVKPLRFSFSAEFWRHCVLCGGVKKYFISSSGDRTHN